MLSDVFAPLFEITRDPSSDPLLHKFLVECVSGFDSVDNEDMPEKKDLLSIPHDPRGWTGAENPPYAYYLYFMWSNIVSLNYFRYINATISLIFLSPSDTD